MDPRFLSQVPPITGGISSLPNLSIPGTPFPVEMGMSGFSEQPNFATETTFLPQPESDEQKAIRLLNQCNWLHGTNGKYLLPMLPHTNQTLKPKGVLINEGIAPLGGELYHRISFFSNNQTCLSGIEYPATESGLGTLQGYANLKYTSESKSSDYFERKAINYISLRIKEIKENTYKLHAIKYVENICRLNLAILQLRQLNNDIFITTFQNELRSLLPPIVDHLEKLKIELKNDPNAKFIINGNHHSCSDPKDTIAINELNNRINQLKKNIQESVANNKVKVSLTPDEKATMDSNKELPLVFCAENPNPVNGELFGERLYPGELKLGDNAVLILTQEEQQDEVKRYLEKHQLKDKVHVHSDDILFPKKRKPDLSVSLELSLKSEPDGSNLPTDASALKKYKPQLEVHYSECDSMFKRRKLDIGVNVDLNFQARETNGSARKDPGQLPQKY